MCSFCSRMIIKAKELGGKYFLKNGKRMCMVCRATRYSPFKKQIRADAIKMRKDLEIMSKEQEAAEQERIYEIASDSLKHDDSKKYDKKPLP